MKFCSDFEYFFSPWICLFVLPPLPWVSVFVCDVKAIIIPFCAFNHSIFLPCQWNDIPTRFRSHERSGLWLAEHRYVLLYQWQTKNVRTSSKWCNSLLTRFIEKTLQHFNLVWTILMSNWNIERYFPSKRDELFWTSLTSFIASLRRQQFRTKDRNTNRILLRAFPRSLF